MLNYRTRVLTYDEARYPFRQLVTAHFRRELTELHSGAPAVPRLQVGMDTQTPMHRHFYGGDDSGVFMETFLSVYRTFMRDVFGAGLLYQAIPNFRVHLPGNVATGNFHRDSDFGHQKEELNILVALTPMHDENSVWVETERGKGDYTAARLSPGQALIFHGAVLSHGSLTNTTGVTRASFDARVLPREKFVPGRVTVNQGVPFDIGKYWGEM